MTCSGFPAEDYGLYVLGSLEAPQRDEIAGHLRAKCPVCTSQVAQYQAMWCAVGASTPAVNPSRKLRSRMIQSVGGRSSWWMMPLPGLAGAAALAVAVAGGWMWAERRAPVPSIAFSPVYKVEISASRATPAPVVKNVVETVVKQVPGATVERIVEKQVEKQVDNPAQAAAIATLNQDLARERQRATELSASLAAAQRALTDSKPGDSNKAVATLTARTQELERQVAQYRVLLEAERKRADQRPSSCQHGERSGSPLDQIARHREESGRRRARHHGRKHATVVLRFETACTAESSRIPALVDSVERTGDRERGCVYA